LSPILRTRRPEIPKSFIEIDKALMSQVAAALALSSRSTKIVAVVLIVVVVVAVSYTALTFPRDVVSFPVAFSIGLDRVQKVFDVPILNDKAQVTVAILSGSSLWSATIIDQNGD